MTALLEATPQGDEKTGESQAMKDAREAVAKLTPQERARIFHDERQTLRNEAVQKRDAQRIQRAEARYEKGRDAFQRWMNSLKQSIRSAPHTLNAVPEAVVGVADHVQADVREVGRSIQRDLVITINNAIDPVDRAVQNVTRAMERAGLNLAAAALSTGERAAKGLLTRVQQLAGKAVEAATRFAQRVGAVGETVANTTGQESDLQGIVNIIGKTSGELRSAANQREGAGLRRLFEKIFGRKREAQAEAPASDQ